MAQFGRPSVDTFRDNWEGHLGETTNLFQKIDEAVADDNDFVRTQLTPTNDVYVTKLSSMVDPLSSSGHVMRYRYGKDASAGDQLDLTVELRQGYTNEGSPGTLIKQISHTNVSAAPQSNAYTLSAGEADSISDYTNLFFRFVFNKP